MIPARPFSAYNQGFYPSKVFIFKLKTDKHFFDLFFAKIESMQPILVRTNEKLRRIARAEVIAQLPANESKNQFKTIQIKV